MWTGVRMLFPFSSVIHPFVPDSFHWNWMCGVVIQARINGTHQTCRIVRQNWRNGLEEVIKGERVGFIDVQILPTPHAICEGIMNDTYTIRWAQVVESEKSSITITVHGSQKHKECIWSPCITRAKPKTWITKHTQAIAVFIYSNHSQITKALGQLHKHEWRPKTFQNIHFSLIQSKR